MSLSTNLTAAFQRIAAEINTINAAIGGATWQPDEPTAPAPGTSYGFVWTGTEWAFGEVQGVVPVDLFVPGWQTFPFAMLEDILGVGTVHAACNIGPQTPTVGGVAFEQSSGNGGDTSVPGAGWSGTNWLLERATAPRGNNTGRTETTPFADLPDASFGQITNADLLCAASLRRNHLITISNLTVGNRYYFAEVYATYPNATRTGTIIVPSDGGGVISFGVGTVNDILQFGIKRYGFTAGATSVSFEKSGDDTNGSYMNAFFCLDQGAP